MTAILKNQKGILEKLNIEQLNPMQEKAQEVIHSQSQIVLLSPTGTGKTLAFLLPIIQSLDPNLKEVQVLILVPSRELAIQIEQVIREMGSGYKTNAVYGGRATAKDKAELNTPPAILIGTPGRIADHFRRGTVPTQFIKTLVLDEFDKSLEVGFAEDMKEITYSLREVEKKILTSATQDVEIPAFIEVNAPVYVDFLKDGVAKLEVKSILSPTKDKLETLVKTLSYIGNQPGIIFCNYRETIQRLSDFLEERNIPHGCFYGGMEQKDRERALIKFRNGTHQLIIATDLAARGIDIPEIKFIIHYHLPLKASEFTHRNGRTARMHNDGTAYVLQWEKEDLPEFLGKMEEQELTKAPLPIASPWKTVFVSGGRKDKISKGDIAGLFFKQGELKKDQLGIIEIKQDCAFVAVLASRMDLLIKNVDHSRLKKKKVRVYPV